MHLGSFLKVNVQNGGILRVAKRGTFICAHAWIFFKLGILITHYIRTMKMYLSN